jgi:hypothetical protein
MSAFKKIAGLVTGMSAVGVIGVALAQGVPPNPYVSNPALGAGQQTVNMTPIGETGVLAWAPEQMQQTAVITREDQQAAVASQPQQVASSESSSNDTTSQQAAPAPSNDNGSQSMGAAPSEDTGAQQPAPRGDRG